MARTVLALLLLCFVSLHAALPSAAAGKEEPVKLVSLLGYDAADSGADDAAPISPDAAAKCHDSCSWLADWHVPAIREAHRSPAERHVRTMPPGLVSLVVPPPR